MPLPPDVAKTIPWVADGVGLITPADGHEGAASLILDEGGDVVLVDAGLAPPQRRLLAPHVDLLLLSHCHVAHTRGAREFREVWAPRDEARALLGPDDFLTTYGVARRDRDLVASGIRKAGYEAAHVTKPLRPGGLLKLDKHEWHLLHAPGHSQGMIVLHDPKRHILFASDIDGEGPPWYGYPTSDPSDLERSATMLADIPTALLLTSHRPPRRRGIKPLLKGVAESIRERDRLVLAAMDKPYTLDELTDKALFLGAPGSPLVRYHERVMIEKHLARLLERDFAHARQDGRYQRLG